MNPETIRKRCQSIMRRLGTADENAAKNAGDGLAHLLCEIMPAHNDSLFCELGTNPGDQVAERAIGFSNTAVVWMDQKGECTPTLIRRADSTEDAANQVKWMRQELSALIDSQRRDAVRIERKRVELKTMELGR